MLSPAFLHVIFFAVVVSHLFDFINAADVVPKGARNAAKSTTATLYNNQSRFDVDGKYVDAHSGVIVAVQQNGVTTYFLYGEHNGNQTGGDFPSHWSNPRLAVYTSPDLMRWTYRGNPISGFATTGGYGWIPSAIFDPIRQRFVLWFGCGAWCVCVSNDGIAFENCTLQWSRLGPGVQTDGTGLFVDDDGTGYIITSLIGSGNSHYASIERLNADYTNSTGELVAGPFPVPMVENSMIFKRNGEYYVALSSCCCACAGGSGLAVFWSPTIDGPYKQQYPAPDINCRKPDATVCRGGPELVWPAQWAHVSLIPLANGDTAHVVVGRRWLSGPHAPSSRACPEMCGNNPLCDAPQYKLATDYEVWLPLHFSPDGHVLRMEQEEAFELQLP